MSQLSVSRVVSGLARRINIPLTATSPPGLVEADTVDPWIKAGKYSLGWTYFCLLLLVLTSLTRLFHWWTDKLRQALYKEEMERTAFNYSPDTEYAMTNLPMPTSRTEDPIFTRAASEKVTRANGHSSAISSIGPINDTLALSRWIFYRPIPEFRYWKKKRLSFPSLAVVAILTIALTFVTLWCFLPQPLYWQSIQFGSPPLAIRAGMIAIAMLPWIIGTSVKSNLISFMTGISHERLNVFHRWGGYLLLFLSLIHTIPFYITPVWDDGGLAVFQKLFPAGSGIIYGTGIAALVPLCFLCVHSLPFLRSMAYEVFVILHVPVAIVFVGMLFWHTHNYLTSWDYLFATAAIWVLSYFTRIFKLNWTKPWRNSWLIGDEAAVTLMSENAIKVTIPTQMKWRPGQFVYLRMPGISLVENHPFTISSLCSEDFPSEYGELYRDCTLVFRPYGGFTRKVLNTAIEKGPFQTYRAYLDGPYGGMQRELAAFDTVFLFAGGSGITAIVSQLLELIKRMRDGKAVTRRVEVVWALKRMEALDWFKEELRICREYAPPDSVTCQFYVTAAKRQDRTSFGGRNPRPISNILHDKLDGFVAGIASKRNSALIRDEAQGDPERERELRAENEDGISALPHQKHLQHNVLPPNYSSKGSLAREASLRRLEGLDAKPQASPKFLSPSSANKSPGRPEFHFPQPSPRQDAPHFQYAPPSLRTSPRGFEFPQQPQATHAPYDPRANYAPYATNTPLPNPPYNRPDSIAQQYFNSASPSRDGERSTSPLPPPSSNRDSIVTTSFPPPPKEAHTKPPRSHNPNLSISIPAPTPINPIQPQHANSNSNFDFGFPSTPTEFQKNLMRFAFVGSKKKEGWSTEYGRPDIPYMLRNMEVGRRTAIFVCGPPGMRVDVANTVARMQADIWGDPERDEIFLHTENYAI